MAYRRRQQIKPAAGLLILLVLATLFSAATGRCQTEATAFAAIHPEQFSVETGAILTVTLNGGRQAEIRLPEVAGLHFQKRGTSTQVQMINNSFSSTTSQAYLVQADRPGQYTIPPISVAVDGTTLTTNPVSFEVAQSQTVPPGQGTGSPQTRSNTSREGAAMAFLRVVEPREHSWVGETIPLRIRAYFRQDIKVNLSSLPTLKGEGFVMPQLSQNPQQTQEDVNGTSYSVLSWDTSISAVKEGKQSLSVDLDATLLLPRRGNPFPPGFGDPDIFQDDFFQNAFGGFESRPVTVSSKPFTLEARALPTAHQPRDFSGAIGHFSLSVQAKPTEVAVGDPLNLTMTVAGSGNFDLVKAPQFPEDPRWKTYPPAAGFKQGDGPNQGKKTFERAVVIKDSHVTELPPASFTFFDPDKEDYTTLTSPPIPITVKATGQGQAAPAPSAPASPPPAVKAEPQGSGIAGLAPIHLQMEGLQKGIRPVFTRAWFIIMQVLCAVLLLGVLLWRLRRSYLRNNPALHRKKEMRELFESSMARIAEAAERDQTRYLAVCRRAIQEMLGRSWRMEPSAITLADLEKRLPPASGLIAVFAEAERGAYANYALSVDRIRQYSEIIRKELSELP